MKKKYICFVAGKSGGHLLPCLTAAKKIIDHDATKEILFFSTKGKLDNQLLQRYPFIQQQCALPLSSLSRKNIISLIRFIITFFYSFFISLWVLYRIKPEKIISMGGAVSLPVCFAGVVLRIPLELLELNAIPGKALEMLAPLASTISCCFKETQKYFSQKCYITSYPLRFTKADSLPVTVARTHLGLDPHKKTIFIIGGSQGSVFINDCIKKWVEKSSCNGEIQVIHQTGSYDTIDWNTFYKDHKIDCFTFSFYHALEYCYSAADLIICRAGAGTLFEVAFFDKPCITIPLETSATTHQLNNARSFNQMYKNIVVLRQEEIFSSLRIFDNAIVKQLRPIT